MTDRRRSGGRAALRRERESDRPATSSRARSRVATEECAEGDEGLGGPVTPPGVRPALLVDASSRRRSPRWSSCNKQRRVGDVSLRDTSRSIDHGVAVDRHRCGDVVVDKCSVKGEGAYPADTHCHSTILVFRVTSVGGVRTETLVGRTGTLPRTFQRDALLQHTSHLR